MMLGRPSAAWVTGAKWHARSATSRGRTRHGWIFILCGVRLMRGERASTWLIVGHAPARVNSVPCSKRTGGDERQPFAAGGMRDRERLGMEHEARGHRVGGSVSIEIVAEDRM